MRRSSKRKAATAMPSSACNPGGRKKAAVSSDGGSLPVEMVMEVLLRLPVKSILRFRAVCRSWAALFSTDVFRSLHMADPASPKLLFVDQGVLMLPVRRQGRRCSALRPRLCLRQLDAATDASTLPWPLPPLRRRRAGLLHLQRSHTGSHTPAAFPPSCHVYLCWIRIRCPGKEVKGGEVYTHGDGGGDGDCWRPPTGGVPLGLRRFARSAIANAALDNLPPVFANGSLHLLVQPNSFFTRPRAAVISFSLSEETFSFVGPPPFWTPEMYSSTALSARETGERPSMPGTLGEHLVQMDNQLCMV